MVVLWILVYVCVVCRFVDSGRRYTAREGIIQEMKPFSHESEWLDQYNWELESDASRAELAADALLIGHLLQKSRRRETWSWTDLDISDHDIGSYAMVRITDNSMFYIDKTGEVRERYYLAPGKANDIRHGGPVYEAIFSEDGAIEIAEHPMDPTLGPIVSLTAVTSDGYVGVIACDKNGRVLQRQMLTEGLVGWIDISLKGHPIMAGGILSHPDYSTHSAFFVTLDGLLAEIDFHTKEWTIHKKPSQFSLAIMIDPAAGVPRLKPSAVLCMTRTGKLVSYDLSTKRWSLKTRPYFDLELMRKPATIVDANTVIFTASNGGVARLLKDEVKYIWHLNTRTLQQFSFATAPCAVENRVFAISIEHQLVSFDLNTRDWSQHSSSENDGKRLAQVRPMFMPSQNKLIVQSVDGELLDYQLEDLI